MSDPKTAYGLKGKLAIVTGASSGIGKEIARGLARQGADVILACRNLIKADAVKRELQADAPSASLSIMQVDLGKLASTRSFAKAFLDRYSKLDILINNAGSWSSDRQLGPDGIDLIWMTNVVAPHLLTQLLLPALSAAAKNGADAPDARIINIASTFAKGLNLNDVEYKQRKYNGANLYAAAKQADRMLTWALADQVRGSGVTANAMSPGLVKTDLNRSAKGFEKFLFGMVSKLGGRTPSEGADTAVWLAAAPELTGVNGKFWENRKELACKYRGDKAAILRLQSICETMAGMGQPVAA